ncbi:Hypothetical predicted protein, partial [Olea europaea subsp. europaea]
GRGFSSGLERWNREGPTSIEFPPLEGVPVGPAPPPMERRHLRIMDTIMVSIMYPKNDPFKL